MGLTKTVSRSDLAHSRSLPTPKLDGCIPLNGIVVVRAAWSQGNGPDHFEPPHQSGNLWHVSQAVDAAVQSS